MRNRTFPLHGGVGSRRDVAVSGLKEVWVHKATCAPQHSSLRRIGLSSAAIGAWSEQSRRAPFVSARGFHRSVGGSLGEVKAVVSFALTISDDFEVEQCLERGIVEQPLNIFHENSRLAAVEVSQLQLTRFGLFAVNTTPLGMRRCLLRRRPMQSNLFSHYSCPV
eukprot:GHVU01078525.1.p1 GENE.GHVU01078525.1~~GHVU01078525.1.p1  ORF type:complete len:165 (+),score=9.84 GHVU01078525.1:1014-1508(+)